MAGDEGVHRRLLEDMSRSARPMAPVRAMGDADVKDAVHEIPSAIHLKRHTWDTNQSSRPGSRRSRAKIIDALRRQGEKEIRTR